MGSHRVVWVIPQNERSRFHEYVLALEGSGVKIVLVSGVEEAQTCIELFDLVIWELNGVPKQGDLLTWFAPTGRYPQQALYDWIRMKWKDPDEPGAVRTLLFTKYWEIIHGFHREGLWWAYTDYAIARKDYSPQTFADRVMWLMR